jgi:exosortase/archaeosortase family protein
MSLRLREPARALAAPAAALALGVAAIGAGELLALALGPAPGAATAELVRRLLEVTGVSALRSGAVLAAPGGFAYEVTAACVGFGPAAVVATVAALRSRTVAAKLAGALAGVATLLAVNLARLVALFHLGVADPDHFVIYHHGLGQAAVLAAMAAFLLLWSRVGRPRAHAPGEAGR